MAGVIVRDQVNVEIVRDVALDLAQEAEELPSAMAGIAGALFPVRFARTHRVEPNPTRQAYAKLTPILSPLDQATAHSRRTIFFFKRPSTSSEV